LGARKFGVSRRCSSTVARARRGVLVHCLTVLLEHKVVTRDSAYRWQQYDVIIGVRTQEMKIVPIYGGSIFSTKY